MLVLFIFVIEVVWNVVNNNIKFIFKIIILYKWMLNILILLFLFIICCYMIKELVKKEIFLVNCY